MEHLDHRVDDRLAVLMAADAPAVDELYRR
jgi:hypothetical protein